LVLDLGEQHSSGAGGGTSTGEAMDVPATSRLITPEHLVRPEHCRRRDNFGDGGGEKHSVLFEVVLDQWAGEWDVPLTEPTIEQPLRRLVQ
jgi:hypothetical protein